MCIRDSYTTDWLADETLRFIKEQKDGRPFLFMVSMPDPHQPFRVRKPYDTMFDPLQMEIPETFYEEELPDWAEQMCIRDSQGSEAGG